MNSVKRFWISVASPLTRVVSQRGKNWTDIRHIFIFTKILDRK